MSQTGLFAEDSKWRFSLRKKFYFRYLFALQHLLNKDKEPPKPFIGEIQIEFNEKFVVPVFPSPQ